MMVVNIASTFRLSLTVTWSSRRFSLTIENMFKDFTTYDSIIPESTGEDAFTLVALNSVCSLEVLKQMFYSAQLDSVSFLFTEMSARVHEHAKVSEFLQQTSL